MLNFLLAMTALTLGVANVLIWRQPAVVKRPVFIAIWVVVLSYSFCMVSPLLLFQAIAVSVAALGLVVPRYGRTVASSLTIVASAFVWGYMFRQAGTYTREVDSLRNEYPLKSMVVQLPEPHMASIVNEVSLTKYEIATTNYSDMNRPKGFFQALHDDQTKSFVNAPGFGPIRMRSPLWMIHSVKENLTHPEPIPQPGTLRDDIDPTGDAVPDTKLREFFGFHAGSIGNFANFKGFGYLRSRREVAGFVPHAFVSEPRPDKPYTLERLELVGLVRNAEPAVYVSEFLPRMAELESLATRPADRFEAAALKKLAAGDDLVANAVGSKVRLLGAVRNMAACVECHGGRRGDLLGAFSYRLAEAK